MNRISLIEFCALYLPVAFAFFCWYYFRPRAGNITGALLLSFFWSLVAVYVVNQLAFWFGWWTYSDSVIAYNGLPLSIWLGWSVCWGLAVPLLPLRGSAVLLLVLIVDLLLMPVLAPLVILGSGWLQGEIVALFVVIVPSLLVYKWTMLKRSINCRVVIQGVIFFSLVGFFLPDIILTYVSGKPFLLPEAHPLVRGIQMNLLFFWIVIGIGAVREFMKQGGGTPIPYDPPERIVRSGVYAYTSNPMQLSVVGGLLAYAWILESWGLAGAALMVIVYSVGIALPSETADLSERFGTDWENYRSGFRPFVPNWIPCRSRDLSIIYFARNCSTCSHLCRWLKSKNTKHLIFEDAENFEGEALERLVYLHGSIRYEGVQAFARGLSHINLGWAIIGCFIQFPLISQVLQLIADAEMFGKTVRGEVMLKGRTESDVEAGV